MEYTYINPGLEYPLTMIVVFIGIIAIMILVHKLGFGVDRARKTYRSMKYAIKMAYIDKIAQKENLDWAKFMFEDYDALEDTDIIEAIVEKKIEQLWEKSMEKKEPKKEETS